MLYFSLAHCYLKDWIVSWGTATNSVLLPLEAVHSNIVQTITYSNFRCHITALYKSLNILKLHDIYKLELAELMHKFSHKMLPTSFTDLFQKTAEVHCHNTRCATKQNYIIQVSTNTGKKKISHQGATLCTNVEQQFKDKSHNALSKQYFFLVAIWMSEKYTTRYIVLNF